MSALHYFVERTCNNGCRGCLWPRMFDSRQVIGTPSAEDIDGRGVRLAGREPTLRADLPQVVTALIAAGAPSVEIETNGRMLSYPSYVRALREAGVTRFVIKLFGCDQSSWEAHTRAPGSFLQTLRGIEVARRMAPKIDLVALVVPRRDPSTGMRQLVQFARERGFRRIRVELRLAKLDLTALPTLADDIRQLRSQLPADTQLNVSTA